MKKQPTPEEYIYALEALKDFRIRQSEEFEQWIQDESHRQLFREVSDYWEAMMNMEPGMAPDTERAWKRFTKKTGCRPNAHRNSRFSGKQIGWSIAIAATLLTAVWLISPFANKTDKTVVAVYPAIEEPQEVVLHTESGLAFTLTDQQDKQLVEEEGAEIVDQENVLRYHQTAEKETLAMHTLTTPRGKNFKVILDDGTEVWLNAESSLRYPVKFTDEERVVELEGEAFFHVAKDSKRAFIVKNQATEAHVLGTQFNFRAYSRESRHITLVSGSVKISDPTSVNELILEPGQDVKLGENKLTAHPVDTNEYTAWTRGLFYFDNTQLTEIMKAIGRWYNLTIVFTDETSMQYHFSFWASREETPQQTIERLNRVGKVKAILEDDRIIIGKS